MIHEDNYMEYREMYSELLTSRNVKDGTEAQQQCLYDTDESSLTERERFIMILAVIVWEIDHNILTPELEDELYLYYEDVTSGKFDGLLGDDEVDEIKKDLFRSYETVFGKE